MYRVLLTTIASATLFAGFPAFAQPLPAGTIPVPAERPAASAFATEYRPSEAGSAAEITGSIMRPDDRPILSDRASTDLKRGLDAIDDDVAAALRIRDGMTRGSLDREILTWAIVTSGEKDVPSWQIAAAASELAGWPGLGSLRAHSERALYEENPPAAQVIAAFGSTRPTTTEGTIVLARALIANGERQKAHDLIVPRWHSQVMNVGEENLILREFTGLLDASDHKRRMDMLLYHERVDQAERFNSMGEAYSLFVARAAVIRRAGNAGALLERVDRSWASDPSYLFARIKHMRQAERYAEAAALLAKAPKDHGALVVPDAWWNEQRIVARGLMEADNAGAAYRIVANHAAEGDVERADAEFHAGWYALRYLNDAKTAYHHFQKLSAISSRPLSGSRAQYWLGRAAEAGAPGNATGHYQAAARHKTTYYGQLAAARLGQAQLSVQYPSPSASERAQFERRRAAAAIQRLQNAGHEGRAASLYRALGEQLDSPGELALLAYMAESRGDHRTALRVGKSAFYRGVDVAALAFPVGVIPADANISSAGKALAYAIARQESEFNKAAVSPADARGLLQLLPGTAKGVASRHGLPYAASRLTTDAGYNATLGSHYLGEQIADFGGSYILTFIAYNAGPRRVGEWIERFGDPRGKPIEEVVDWVEMIPYPETRNYVQRVMENYQVYKSRLGATTDIVHDLRYGRS